jgi:hypothetical protein
MVDNPDTRINKEIGAGQQNESTSDVSAGTRNPNAEQAEEYQDSPEEHIKIIQDFCSRVAWPRLKNWSKTKAWPVLKSSSFWTAAATVVIAVSTIVYTHYAQKQWDVMNRQLQFTERPWISLEGFTVESPLTFDTGGGGAITIGFDIKNTGQSPAIMGFWQPDLFLQFGETPSPVRMRDRMCNVAELRSTKVTDQRIAETWFPGPGLHKSININFTPDDVSNALKIPNQLFPNLPRMKDFDYIYPDFVVCVAYRSSFTDAQYHTGYILRLLRSNPDIPYIPPLKSREIPVNELKLLIHQNYGIDAN